MDYSEIYIRRIRSLCAERGIAINRLAVMSDVKQSTLDNIVRGLTKNPRVKTLHKLALASMTTPTIERELKTTLTLLSLF